MSGIGNTIQGPSRPTRPPSGRSPTCCRVVRGNHTLKMGGEFRRGTEDSDLGFFFVGRFVFNGAYTGDSFADFLLGRAIEFNHATGRTKLDHAELELRRVLPGRLQDRATTSR